MHPSAPRMSSGLADGESCRAGVGCPRRGQVSLPGHPRSAMERVPRHRGAGRDRRWRGHGLDRRRAPHPVVVPDLPGFHQSVGPPRVGVHPDRRRGRTVARLPDRAAARGEAGQDPGGAHRHPSFARRRPPPLHARFGDAHRQHRRGLVGPGSAGRSRRATGRPTSARRVRHDGQRGTDLRSARRGGLPDRLLHTCPGDAARVRNATGATPAPDLRPSGWHRRAQQPGGPGRHRQGLRLRVRHSGARSPGRGHRTGRGGPHLLRHPACGRGSCRPRHRGEDLPSDPPGADR